jgi:hypothetical protein
MVSTTLLTLVPVASNYLVHNGWISVVCPPEIVEDGVHHAPHIGPGGQYAQQREGLPLDTGIWVLCRRDTRVKSSVPDP